MKSISDILKVLTVKISKTVWFLGLHAFLFILSLVLVGCILGRIVFYRYAFLPEKEGYKATENVLRFDYKSYQNVLNELQAKEQGWEAI